MSSTVLILFLVTVVMSGKAKQYPRRNQKAPNSLLRKRSKLTIGGVSLAIGLLFAQFPSGAAANQVDFFTDAAPPPESLVPDLPSLRERFVNVDLDLLRTELYASGWDRTRKVAFHLFDDVVVEGTIGNFDPRPDGYSSSVSGQTAEGIDQIAVVTVHDRLESLSRGGGVFAQFWSGSKRYSLQSIQGTLHVIYELDTSLLAGGDEGTHGPDDSIESSGDEGPSLIPIGAAGAGGTPASSASTEPFSDNMVDILVVHTQAARLAQPGMLAWIQNQIDQGNEANRRSGLSFRFRLVKEEGVTYSETTNNMGQDLYRLQDSGDNTIDNAHTLRDNYGADVVVLVGSGWSSCGVGFQMNSPVSTSFASSAFSVVNVKPGCALTFVHEIGHNMSLRHAWGDPQGDGVNSPFPYNHGFASTTGDFRTVMAYQPQGCVTSCPRIPNWSDPDVLYNTHPTGEAYNDLNPSLTPQPEDNARAIAQTYDTVSKFRIGKSIGGSGSLDPGTVSWGPGRLDVFERGSDNALKHKYYDGTAWSAWENLGGQITSAPDASSRGPGLLDVFAQGADGAIWRKWYDGNGWSVGWQSLGGQATSAPSSISWGTESQLLPLGGGTPSGRIDVFARGADNAIWRKWYDDASGWSGHWESLGGGLASAPDVSSWGPGRLDVFARGGDNAIWHKSFDGGSWAGWWGSLGGGLISDPGAVSWGPGRIDVFARGADNALWHKWYDGNGWLGYWESLGGIITSGPDAASWASGHVDALARGGDNTIWRREYDGQWLDWQD